MLHIAKIAIDERMDYEALKYSDYMYGKESLTEEVWEYVIEAQEQGMHFFTEKYAEYFR